MSLEQTLENILGKPYADLGKPPESFNCLQCVAWVRRALNLNLPVIFPTEPWDSLSADQQLSMLERTRREYGWQQVAQPAMGDIVLCAGRPGLPSYHCGVFLPQGIVHAYSSNLTGLGSVVITKRSVFERVYSTIEYWRHA